MLIDTVLETTIQGVCLNVVAAAECSKQCVRTQSTISAALSLWLVWQTEPNRRGWQLFVPTRKQSERVRDHTRCDIDHTQSCVLWCVIYHTHTHIKFHSDMTVCLQRWYDLFSAEMSHFVKLNTVISVSLYLRTGHADKACILFSCVCLSVCLSVCLFVCLCACVDVR